MDSCDVLIIGAGIAGAATAYELAPYASVILLERHPTPTTDHPAAGYAPGPSHRVIRTLTRASRGFLEARAGGLAPHSLLTPRGALIVAREDQLERLEGRCAALAPTLERLDRQGALARMPALRPDYVAGAGYDPELWDLHAATLHHAYVVGFQARGGRLVTGAEVLRIGGAGAPWQVESRAGGFESAVLVDAAGAQADRLARLAGVPPVGLTFRQRSACLFQPTLEPDPAWPLVIDVDEVFRFKPADGLVLGLAADAPAPSDAAPLAEPVVAPTIARIEQASRLRMHRLIQSFAWLCAFTADGAPVVGMEETVPGFFWLAGLGDVGFQIAPALARCAARLLVDGVLPDDLLALGLTVEDLMPARLRPLAYRPANTAGV